MAIAARQLQATRRKSRENVRYEHEFEPRKRRGEFLVLVRSVRTLYPPAVTSPRRQAGGSFGRLLSASGA